MSIATSNGNVWKTTVPESTGNGDYTPCPAGNYPGRICGLFDVGSHPVERDDKKTGGKRTVDVRQLVIVFELDEKQPNTGKPYTMGVKYTFSMNEKSILYSFVKNVTGAVPRPGQIFDPTTLLGRPVMVTVAHKLSADGKKIYANVGAVADYPKNFSEPVATITPVAWSVQERTDFPEADWHPYIYGKSIKVLAGESREVCGYGGAMAPLSINSAHTTAPTIMVRNNVGDYPIAVQALMDKWNMGPGYGIDDINERVEVASMPKIEADTLIAYACPF